MVLIPRSAPKISFGTRGREQQAPETPGPGHYSGAPSQTLRTSNMPRGATFNFGTSSRGNRSRHTPGPGAYTARDGLSRRSGPAFSMRPRRSSSRWRFESCGRDSGPGPGSYRVDNCLSLNEEAPKYSMGTKGFDEVIKAGEIPGPGHYGLGSRGLPKLTPRNKPGFGFGTSTREPGKDTHTPGPGQYSSRTSLGTCGAPSYSLYAKRRYSEPKETVPGPGAHDVRPNFGD